MVLTRLKTLIADQLGIEQESITLETNFQDDLGVDSLDFVELTMAMEEEFDLEEMGEEDLAKIFTVGDLLQYIQQKLDI